MEAALRSNLRRMTVNHLVEALPLYPAPRPVDRILVTMCRSVCGVLGTWPVGEEAETDDVETLKEATEELAELLGRKKRPTKDGDTDALVLVLADALSVVCQQWSEVLNLRSPSTPPRKRPRPPSPSPSIRDEPVAHSPTPIAGPNSSLEAILERIQPSSLHECKEEGEAYTAWSTDLNDAFDYTMQEQAETSPVAYPSSSSSLPEDLLGSWPRRRGEGRSTGGTEKGTQKRLRLRCAFHYFFDEVYSDKKYPDKSHRERRALAEREFAGIKNVSEWQAKADEYNAKKKSHFNPHERSIRLPRPQRPLDMYLLEMKDILAAEHPHLTFNERRSMVYRMWGDVEDKTPYEAMATRHNEKLREQCPSLFTAPRRNAFSFFEREKFDYYKSNYPQKTTKQRRTMIYAEWRETEDRSKWTTMYEEWKNQILMNVASEMAKAGLSSEAFGEGSEDEGEDDDIILLTPEGQ